jgi:C-3',4' desaturase CrtD
VQIVVIGAGVGGLTVGAILAQAGLSVTVLEASEHLGGCASTFEVNGFRFDVGATVAGGFAPDGPMTRLEQWLDLCWEAHPVEPVMVVHLPDGSRIVRWGERERWRRERLKAFGEIAEPFWRWQEHAAEVLWSLAMRLPPWLPQTRQETLSLFRSLFATLTTYPSSLRLLPDAFRTVADHLPKGSPRLRQFVDAQLLIAAQCTSERANALYGAAALDLPHRGVVHLKGGMGTLAETLADAVRRYGGIVLCNCPANRIIVRSGKPIGVETEGGDFLPAEIIVANVTPYGLAQLLGEAAPSWLQRILPYPDDGWGAFTLYLGVDEKIFPPDFATHHQILCAEPLAEGNSVFLSVSPEWDETRAPKGFRTLTLSTHTRLPQWWQAWQDGKATYERLKADYTERMLKAAERSLPSLRDAIRIALPGTPLTFQRYTRRPFGWVGGFPQTSLFRTVRPCIADGIWIVGDSVFPGQSTAAVAIAGMRVAFAILHDLGISLPTKATPALAMSGARRDAE